MRSLVAYSYSSDPSTSNALVPDMATDTGSANADVTAWTFTLRDGLTWQDGSPVTCEDVKYGVSRTFATDVINGGPLTRTSIWTSQRRTTAHPNTKAHIASKVRTFSTRRLPATGARLPFISTSQFPTSITPRRSGLERFRTPLTIPASIPARTTSATAVWSDGPYQITSYSADRHNPGGATGSLIADRNPNWNPASDDYRGAYADKWEVGFRARSGDD